jgi:hypothetical protein
MTNDVFDAICKDMETPLSLRKACLKNGTHHNLFLAKAKESEELQNQYERARLFMIDAVADEWLSIIDEEPEYITETSSGREETTVSKMRIDPASVANKKVRADARQWYLSKLAPKKFGDSSRIEHSGEVKTTLVRSFGGK